ncbi:hypothetical protein IG631_21508 [Alternaria alternata]|nr:hypothetical protein IG631_21508 [Alternaria alternata]
MVEQNSSCQPYVRQSRQSFGGSRRFARFEARTTSMLMYSAAVRWLEIARWFEVLSSTSSRRRLPNNAED